MMAAAARNGMQFCQTGMTTMPVEGMMEYLSEGKNKDRENRFPTLEGFGP